MVGRVIADSSLSIPSQWEFVPRVSILVKGNIPLKFGTTLLKNVPIWSLAFRSMTSVTLLMCCCPILPRLHYSASRHPAPMSLRPVPRYCSASRYPADAHPRPLHSPRRYSTYSGRLRCPDRAANHRRCSRLRVHRSISNGGASQQQLLPPLQQRLLPLLDASHYLVCTCGSCFQCQLVDNSVRC
jgi:hypothetical protein